MLPLIYYSDFRTIKTWNLFKLRIALPATKSVVQAIDLNSDVKIKRNGLYVAFCDPRYDEGSQKTRYLNNCPLVPSSLRYIVTIIPREHDYGILVQMLNVEVLYLTTYVPCTFF